MQTCKYNLDYRSVLCPGEAWQSEELVLGKEGSLREPFVFESDSNISVIYCSFKTSIFPVFEMDCLCNPLLFAGEKVFAVKSLIFLSESKRLSLKAPAMHLRSKSRNSSADSDVMLSRNF